jgi:multidrug resistance protein, MATE family
MLSRYRLYRSHIRNTAQLSYPIIISQLGLVLMGVADNIMVGRLGSAALAAAGISNSVFFVITVIGTGGLAVVSPMVASAMSRKDADESPGAILNAAHIASRWMAGGIMALLILMIFLFDLLGQPEEVNVLAKPYMWIITASVLPMFHFWAGKQFTDGLGNTRAAMLVTLAGLVLNVILNLILIFGFMGIPAFGLNGAGFATLISRILMAFFMHKYIYGDPTFAHWLVHTRTQSTQVVRIIKMGLPSGLQYFFETAAFGSAAVIAGWLGTASLAAHQIAINLASITYMVAAGVSAAGAIRVGNASGLKLKVDVLKAGTSSIFMVLAFMSLAGIGFILFHKLLIRLYIDDPEVEAIAAGLLMIAAAFQLSDGVQVVGLGILRGLMDVYVPTFIALISYWVIGLPLGYVLAMYGEMGVSGIWIGLLTGLTISAALMTRRFYTLGNRIGIQQ